MITEYFARLICLSLAAFFVVHLGGGLAVAAATAMVVRMVGRMRPRIAARILLTLRFLPVAGGLFVVAVLCVPSYLWLEPGEAAEEVGPACLVAAALAVAVWAFAIFRGSGTVLRSQRCINAARDTAKPLVAVAGVLRPRLLLSNVIRQHLSRDQLAAALRHERAHITAWDNGKRLLLAFAPGLIPGVHGFSALERHWSRFTEWAADDDAIRGDADRALALAGALVRVARLGGVAVPLAAGLLDGGDLSERVERLLFPAPEEPRDAQPIVVTAAAALTVVAFFATIMNTTFSYILRLK